MSPRTKVVPDEILSKEFLDQFKKPELTSAVTKATSSSSLGKDA